MLRFLAGRLVQVIIAMMVMSFAVFILGSLTGSEIDFLLPLDQAVSPEHVQRLREAYGLDKPLLERYGDYMLGLLQGNLGFSRLEQRPVVQVIASRLPATLQLAGGIVVASIVIAIPIGVLSAVKRGTPIDHFARTIALLGQAVPTFWLAIVLILVFGVWLRVLPIAGRGGIEALVLPVFAAMGFLMAGLLRITRSAMLDIMDSEYIKFARAKGVSGIFIVWKHGFRNVLIPVTTYVGIMLGAVLNGAIVTEIIFAWPGLGRVALAAVQERDFVLLQGVVLFSAALYLGINLLVDVLYAFMDPRIRYSGLKK